MAIFLNQSTVASQPMGDGIARQQLLGAGERNTFRLAIERLTLGAGATLRCATSETALEWLYLLAGEARLTTENTAERVSGGHCALLPPSFTASVSTVGGTALLRIS